MKKSLLFTLTLVSLYLLFSPQGAGAQSGYSYSEIGYSSSARYVYGYSETWIDYDLYMYYDPAVREIVSNVVEIDLAHPCLSLRFTSRCQDNLIAQSAWQSDVPQFLRMTQPLQTLLRSLHDLED